ncbi:MAG: GH3 auxin-responsive promoter family protein, partial [Treponema sp.]|nr:GH3 auxin-responsive promoter family protein [Treponema sp.]
WAFLHIKKSVNWKENPVESQKKWLAYLIKKAKKTRFGKDYRFSEIKSVKDFQERVPILDYEAYRPYIEKVQEGQKDILWPGIPLYLAKTSGTTSGTKFIPISKESMPFHIDAAKSALFHYITKRKNANFVDGKVIFVQGSPELKENNGIKIGRLSGISAHYVPSYLQRNRLPSWETNCIKDWEQKVNKIVDETINQDMTLIGGIPPWLVMYFEKLSEKSGKAVGELFPNLQLLVTGGVNYNPYQEKIDKLIGRHIDVIQTYPASEGFIAFQDDADTDDLLLLLDHGIFYEFVPIEDIEKDNPRRLTIGEVELNKDYAILLTTNAGLYAYLIGDLVRFVNKNPYKILVSGRVKHFTSAFGEHVISVEAEEAMKGAIQDSDAIVKEFILSPQVNPAEGLPYHEWFIEFEKEPSNIEDFAQKLDMALRKKNTYYNDLVAGKVLRTLKISVVRKDGFNEFMKGEGKLGGQNKIPRLSNNRQIAEKLTKFVIS